MRSNLMLALLSLTLCCADTAINISFAANATSSDHTPLALIGGTIIDLRNRGRSEQDQTNMTVLVENGRIVQVGTTDSVPVPDRYRRIDAHGRYLVPGLTDLFAGLNNQAQADAYLAMGVTTIVASDGDDRRGPLFRDAKPGPRIRLMSIGDGLKWPEKLPDSVTSYPEALQYTRPLTRQEVIAEIEQASQSGSSLFLLHYGVSDRQLKWYTKAARTHQIATIGELGAAHYRSAIRSGVETFTCHLIATPANRPTPAIQSVTPFRKPCQFACSNSSSNFANMAHFISLAAAPMRSAPCPAFHYTASSNY